jgi:hypothetical protein
MPRRRGTREHENGGGNRTGMLFNGRTQRKPE